MSGYEINFGTGPLRVFLVSWKLLERKLDPPKSGDLQRLRCWVEEAAFPCSAHCGAFIRSRLSGGSQQSTIVKVIQDVHGTRGKNNGHPKRSTTTKVGLLTAHAIFPMKEPITHLLILYVSLVAHTRVS